MRSPFATAVAIAVGLTILLGYFVPIPLLQQVRYFLLDWGVILFGIATLVGIINLVTVHWRKMTAQRNRDLYSAILILAFLLTLAAGLVLTPSHPQFQHVVTSIQAPAEISLLAILAISLAYASLRLLSRRRGTMSIVFVVSVIVFLFLGANILPALQNNPAAAGLAGFVNRLPLAGARGILLGVALGSVTTGIRILLGADRPYSG